MNPQRTKWDESFKAGRDYNPLNEILLDLILSKIDNSKKTGIDLGCGTGDAMLKLVKRGMKVTGTDWSLDAIKKAKQRVEEAGFSDAVSFFEVDLNFLSDAGLSKNSADFILCKLVIAFVDDKKVFCQAVKSLLNDRGVFVIQTPVLHDSVKYTPEDKHGIAVKYEEFKSILHEVFSEVIELNNSYYSDRGKLVTFLVK